MQIGKMDFNIETTYINEIKPLILDHLNCLAFPIESWFEDRLLESNKFKITLNNYCIGYLAILEDEIYSFYITKKYFKYASSIFEKIIEQNSIKKVFILSQDPFLSSLISEWDYTKEKIGCFFSDSGNEINISDNNKNLLFRNANLSDVEKIKNISGDFFDEASGGFNTFEDRITANTIFVLEDSIELYGVGVIEKSQIIDNVISIGMFVNKEHRKRGIAQTILIYLKNHVKDNNAIPVSGCWYYNTLSRKSLESAGMIASTIGYDAILIEKENLPLRTGNPPGELVE